MLNRRSLLKAAAAAAAVRPGIVRAASTTTLRFIPVIALAFVDPIYASSGQVSRKHGFMVFDTLYGMNSKLEVSPQMVEGHTTDSDGKLWNLTLREGLLWHDGEKVLARDCVASIKRWAKRDAFGQALMVATDELSAADDRTIRFRLNKPFALLLGALGKSPSPTRAMMRPNHLQTPFNNPEVRRAFMWAIDQDEFMQAIVGNDSEMYHTPLGMFCPHTPMASEDGLEPLKGPRDYDKVKEMIKRAGYA